MLFSFLDVMAHSESFGLTIIHMHQPQLQPTGLVAGSLDLLIMLLKVSFLHAYLLILDVSNLKYSVFILLILDLSNLKYSFSSMTCLHPLSAILCYRILLQTS